TRVFSTSRTLPLCSCADIASDDPRQSWGQCLMIATDFSRGKPMDGPPLDARATPRVKVSLFGALSTRPRSGLRALWSAGAQEATRSRPVRQAHLFIPVRNMLYGNRHGQVVQRRKRLWLHHPG